MRKTIVRFAVLGLIVVAAARWGKVVLLAQSSSQPTSMPVLRLIPRGPSFPITGSWASYQR